METKGIDLRKCNNLRYRAKVDGNNDYGRICVENADTGLAFLRSDLENGYVATWHCDAPTIEGICGRKVTDFEIVPRDPETYRDWQVGDKVCENEHRNACSEVIFRSGELVVFKDWNNRASNPMTCSEAFTRFGMRLVLTDIEQQIIGEKQEYEPQDGDVVYAKVSHNDNDAIFIYKKAMENRIYGYAGYNIRFDKMVDTHGFAYITPNIIGDLTEYRPSTDEEKQMLFDAMAKEGKRWNAEKKVVEDIPRSHEFKKGEPVLVRSDRTHCWQLRVISLSVYGNPPKVEVTDGCDEWIYWIDKDEVIPYNERTMHLLGTTEDYKEGE